MPDYSAVYTNSFALVAGIDRYEILPPLNAAVKGAEDLATILRDRYGFQVTLLKDAQVTRDAIFDWLTTTRRQATGDDRVLIYLAGHGITRATGSYERGYFALSGSVPDAWYTALPMDDITEEARFIPAKHLLYVLDSCFSGLALEGRAVDVPRELDYYLTRPVHYAISAGGKEVVDDSMAPDGQHSIFTYHMLRWLSDDQIGPQNGIWRARELGNFLEQAVAHDRRGGHKPNHSYLPGSGDGDFVFHWTVGTRLPRDVELALRSGNDRVRLGATAALIDIARGDDKAQVALATEALARLSDSDPNEKVRRTAHSFFAQDELARATATGSMNLRDLQAKQEEAKRLQAEAHRALEEAIKERERAESAEESLQATRRTLYPKEAIIGAAVGVAFSLLTILANVLNGEFVYTSYWLGNSVGAIVAGATYTVLTHLGNEEASQTQLMVGGALAGIANGIVATVTTEAILAPRYQWSVQALFLSAHEGQIYLLFAALFGLIFPLTGAFLGVAGSQLGRLLFRRHRPTP